MASLHKFEMQKWFRKIYNKYSQKMYLIAYSILRNSADAEDAVQDSFMNIYRYSQKLYNLSSDKMDICIVILTRNAAINIYRVNRRERERFVPIGEMNYMHDETTREKIDYDLLIYEISKLPVKYRDAVMLHFVGGFSVPETAEILGISRSAAYYNITRAKKMLEDEKKNEKKK